MAALLRTVMHEAVFTDIQISAAGVAVPRVGKALCKVSLELIVVNESRKRVVPSTHDLFVNVPLPRAEWLKLAGSVVKDAHGALQSEFPSALRNSEGFFRPAHVVA